MTGLVKYPFPLRDDCIVYVMLPADVTVEEVERVVKMMRTLPTSKVGL